MYSKDNPRTSRDNPESSLPVENPHAAFSTGKPFPEKKTNLLPAMGCNSWNSFGTGNTEALTKQMEEYADNMQYEQAAVVRDQILEIEKTYGK